MCQFITAFLPGAADRAASEAIFEAHKIGVKPVVNLYVLAQLPSGEICLLTTRAWCDCDTPLGSLAEGRIQPPAPLDSQIIKLRKQNWSEAKIQRWREQKRQTGEKQERYREAQAVQAGRDAGRWVTFLADLLRSGHTPRIGLLLHFYNAGLETERIGLLQQEVVPVSRLSTDQLLRIEKDVLYQYVP